MVQKVNCIQKAFVIYYSSSTEVLAEIKGMKCSKNLFSLIKKSTEHMWIDFGYCINYHNELEECSTNPSVSVL